MSKYEQLVETKTFLQEKGIGHIDFGMRTCWRSKEPINL